MARKRQIKPRPQLAARKKKDDGFQDDREIRTFMLMLAEHVKYSDFIDLEPALSTSDFLKLRNLAIIDRFYQLTDEEITAKTGNAAAQVKRLREHPHMKTILAAIEEKARHLAKPRTFDKWAEDAEDRVAAETLAVALTEGKSKEKLAALAEFSSRTSGKKGRDDGGQRAPMFPEDVLKLMYYARHVLPPIPAPDEEVNGSVLRVPGTRKLLPGGGE